MEILFHLLLTVAMTATMLWGTVMLAFWLGSIALRWYETQGYRADPYYHEDS